MSSHRSISVVAMSLVVGIGAVAAPACDHAGPPCPSMGALRCNGNVLQSCGFDDVSNTLQWGESAICPEVCVTSAGGGAFCALSANSVTPCALTYEPCLQNSNCCSLSCNSNTCTCRTDADCTFPGMSQGQTCQNGNCCTLGGAYCAFDNECCSGTCRGTQCM